MELHEDATAVWADELEKEHGARWTDEYLAASNGYIRTAMGHVRCPGCGQMKSVQHVNRAAFDLPRFMAACFHCFKAGKRKWFWQNESWNGLLEELDNDS